MSGTVDPALLQATASYPPGENILTLIRQAREAFERMTILRHGCL